MLDAMTAPADAMREHLAGANQNATLGAAAEVGVRNLLRAVVPTRIGVTSGFLRELTAGASASPSSVGAEPKEAVAVDEAGATNPTVTSSSTPTLSPQTDVLLYDASYAVPLYGIGGVDVLSAHDVLGVIEVKDTNQGTDELGTSLISRKDAQGAPLPPEKNKGALEHIDSVRRYAGRALRGVVLFRGKGGLPGSEAQAVKRLVLAEFMAGRTQEAPHFVYCATSPIGGVDKGSSKDSSPSQGGYLAFYNCLSEEVRVVEYVDDRVSPLAGFLRIVTGFLAAQGLVSPALHLDMRPVSAPPSETFELPGRPKPQELYRLVAERRAAEGAELGSTLPTFEMTFVDMLQQEQDDGQEPSVWAFVSTGPGPGGVPTSGYCLQVQIARKGLLRAFFYLVEPGLFGCTGAQDGDEWRIEAEAEGFDGYMRRTLRENGLIQIYQKKTSDPRRLPEVGVDAKPFAEGKP